MADSSLEETRMFHNKDEEENKARQVLLTVYKALDEKGYNPISQLVGYLISGDPVYITSYGNARDAIQELERDDLLEELVSNYLNSEKVL